MTVWWCLTVTYPAVTDSCRFPPTWTFRRHQAVSTRGPCIWSEWEGKQTFENLCLRKERAGTLPWPSCACSCENGDGDGYALCCLQCT